MKSDTTAIKKLNALLKKIGRAEEPELPETTEPADVLVLSFLMWESSSSKAVTAYRKLRETMVDLNDLRVCMPHEVVEIIGERYPRAEDRAIRIRAALRDIYLREHAMTLERLEKTGKREVRKYFDSLEGVVPYVASRVLLMCFDTHAIPVDEQLAGLLRDQGAAPDLDVAELTTWLTRQVKASGGRQAHYDLQAWSDSNSSRAPSRPRKKTAGGRPATKKKTTKRSGTTAKATSSKTTRKTKRKTTSSKS